MEQDELLADGDVLADGELVAAATRGEGELRAGVRIGRPLIYPVEPAELPVPLRRRAETAGVRYAGVLFAFDLADPPGSRRYSSARFTVQLDGSVIAARVHADGGQFGVEPEGEPASAAAARAYEATSRRPGLLRRLGSRDDRPRAQTWGAQSGRFGWSWAGGGLAATYGMHALVELPAGVGELAGRLTADADVTGTVRRRIFLSQAVSFHETVPSPSAPTGAAVRLCMAADVVAYSSRINPEAKRVQQDLVDVLAAGRRAAGIEPGDVVPQPQGDGQFTVLPVSIDESVVIPRLIGGVAAALARVNAVRPERERIRLRVALHRGLVEEAANGWVGHASTAVHRILDSPPMRDAVGGHPGAPYVLGVPDVLFLDVITHTTEPPPAAAFTAMTVDLPAKGYREHCWLYVPEVAA
jgi:hypothetical protein